MSLHACSINRKPSYRHVVTDNTHVIKTNHKWRELSHAASSTAVKYQFRDLPWRLSFTALRFQPRYVNRRVCPTIQQRNATYSRLIDVPLKTRTRRAGRNDRRRLSVEACDAERSCRRLWCRRSYTPHSTPNESLSSKRIYFTCLVLRGSKTEV